MSILESFVDALTGGGVEVVDLTAPLSAETPVIQLPPEFGQTARFELEEISRYDDRGPAWYWNNIRTGEHTGTHLDAPNHWVTGRDGEDVASVPATRLIAPAVVLDFSDRVAEDPDFLLEVDARPRVGGEHGPLPDGGWLLYRTGWDARSDSQERFLNADDDRPPHARAVIGVRALGGRGGAGRSAWASRRSARTPARPTPSTRRSPATPTYGQRQVRPHPAAEPRPAAADRRGLVVGPLPIVTGSGSPARAAGPRRALRGAVNVASAVGQALVRAGRRPRLRRGRVGQLPRHQRDGGRGARFVAARHEGGAATMADAYARVSGRVARSPSTRAAG